MNAIILGGFVRKMRVQKCGNGWVVMKKYHGYWYQEIPISFDTKASADAALARYRKENA